MTIEDSDGHSYLDCVAGARALALIGGEQCARLSQRYIESSFDQRSGAAPSAAAMLVEPAQGEDGIVPAPDDWMRGVRRSTAERGNPVIADEAQTGMGRTGAFWAIEHTGMTPDVMVLWKAIGGSLPFAAIVCRGGLKPWAPCACVGAFRGSHLAMAASAATLRQLAEADLSHRARFLGDRMLCELRLMATERPCVDEVRDRGLMVEPEPVDPDAATYALVARPPAPELAALTRTASLRRGLIVKLGGRSAQCAAAAPASDHDRCRIRRGAGASVASPRRRRARIPGG